MKSPVEELVDSSLIINAASKIEDIHTFYLNVNGNILIDKRTCELLELHKSCNLVLVKNQENGKYSLEIRN